MAVFDFNDGAALVASNAATPSISFDETSEDTLQTVRFTLSSAATNSGNESVAFSPNTLQQLSLSDFGGTGAFTFGVAVTQPNKVFQGDGMQLTLGTFTSGNWNVTFVAIDPLNGNAPLPASNVVVAVTGPGQVISIGTTTTVFSGIRFTTSSGSGASLTVDSLTTTLLCFLEGTRIATPGGDKRVEDLRAGDVVSTADGGTTTVQWLGEQPVETATAHPAKVNPIRIAAGALAENVPSRDLMVSPDHAIWIEGYLVNASALVNGTTITRETQMPARFTYYHVETGRHELLLAEGCAAESYVDFVGRDGFANGAERADAPAIPEMAVPRISAARHLPPQIRDRLAARAGAASRAA